METKRNSNRQQWKHNFPLLLDRGLFWRLYAEREQKVSWWKIFQRFKAKKKILIGKFCLLGKIFQLFQRLFMSQKNFVFAKIAQLKIKRSLEAFNKQCMMWKIMYVWMVFLKFRQGQDTSTVYHYLKWQTVEKIGSALALNSDHLATKFTFVLRTNFINF